MQTAASRQGGPLRASHCWTTAHKGGEGYASMSCFLSASDGNLSLKAPKESGVCVHPAHYWLGSRTRLPVKDLGS